MPASASISAAYRFHRQTPCGYRPGGVPVYHAPAVSIALARADVIAGRDRFPPAPFGPSVCWQSDSGRGERLGYVESLEAAGLRIVGDVNPESYGGRDTFEHGSRRNGWLTDPHGDYSDDGTGLCWGVVVQLPGRNGVARFLAGYQMGGCDGGPTIDFGTVYESDCRGLGYGYAATDVPAAREAARAADHMAQRSAEEERDYQSAWQAGSQYADFAEAVAISRREALALIAARKRALREDVGPEVALLAAEAMSAIRTRLSLICRDRATMRKLAAGDVTPVFFSPSEDRLRSAFCEGASLARFPA